LQTAKVNVLRALKELVENGYMKMEGKRYVLTDEGNAYTKQVRGAERLFNSEESENVEG
jgi:predicted transcriptional regulator